MIVTMTVKVDFQLTDWKTTFGMDDATQTEIREDVRTYVEEGLQGHGVFGNGEVGNKITVSVKR